MFDRVFNIGVDHVYDTTNSLIYANRITSLDADEYGVLWVGSGMVDYNQLGMTAHFESSDIWENNFT